MNHRHKFSLTSLLIIVGLLSGTITGEVVEEIYAIVNDEIITHTEFSNAEAQMINELRSRFQGEDLRKAMQGIKQKVMDSLIQHKLILSTARDRGYNVDNEVEMIIQEIKKQNNFTSDRELERALEAEGITLEEFKEQQAMMRMQQHLIFEEVTAKIKVENAEIVDYYKNHRDEFTRAGELSLNCIFLNKDNYFTESALNQKRQDISDELMQTSFEEVARQHSELSDTENNIFLGTFKEGELDETIETTALSLQEGEYSGWVETGNGWYILQLISHKKPETIPLAEVQDRIKSHLTSQQQQEYLDAYIERLKRDSYIKIHKTFE